MQLKNTFTIVLVYALCSFSKMAICGAHIQSDFGKVLDLLPVVKALPLAKFQDGENEFVENIDTTSQMSDKTHIFSKRGSRYLSGIEDRWAVETGLTGIKYYAVYDGHGGHQVSELLKTKFHLFLDENRHVWEKKPEQIAGLFVDFDQRTLKVDGKHGNPGSTAVMLIEIPENDSLIIVNLGDSPAVVVKKNGDVLRSTDHNPSDESEKAIIEKKGGRIFYLGGVPRVCGTLAVARAFGNASIKQYMTVEPDIYTISRGEVSFVALMSDGVGEAWPIGKKDSVEGVAQYLNDLLKDDDNENVAETFYNNLQFKGTDDITLLVIPFA